MTISTDHSALIRSLASEDLKLAETIRLVDLLEKNASFPHSVKIGISANITCDNLGLFLKKNGFQNNLKIEVVLGNYDSHFENFEVFARSGVETVILLDFFDNILAQLESQAKNFSTSELENIKGKYSNALKLLLGKGNAFRRIIIPTLHALYERTPLMFGKAGRSLIEELNGVIRAESAVHSNVSIIDSSEIIGILGFENSFDPKMYQRFKAPYKAKYFDRLARELIFSIRANNSYYYKVLIMDCDNTLWGGIIGEDGLSGIKLDPHEYPGSIFWRIQNEIKYLQSQGILICLASKNNATDVDNVLESHPNAVLKQAHLVLKKVNWEDKAVNIAAIAKELNLGLDSFIFVDDSSFECDFVRNRLPAVKVFQVPPNLSEFPAMWQTINSLFLGGLTEESLNEQKKKTSEYQTRQKAIEYANQFENEDDYFKSLEIKVDLKRNSRDTIARAAQLTQKTNQFNVTTKRYEEHQIADFMQSPTHDVFTFSVADKFGDSGITGIVITELEKDKRRISIDSFLMSCRVLGRRIESTVLPIILNYYKKSGFEIVHATYVPTNKNALVATFFEDIKFNLMSTDNGVKHYSLAMSSLPAEIQTFVDVSFEKT